MKLLVASLVVLFATSANAKILSKMCLVATNPQVIKVEIDATGEKSVGKKATGALIAETFPRSEGEISRSAGLVVVTTKGTKVSIGAALASDPKHEDISKVRRYNVDCDGGGMDVAMGKKALVANSDYIVGEAHDDVDCAPATVSFENLVLKKVECD